MDFRIKPPIILFLSDLRILIPERAQWNGGVPQGQRGMPIFTDGSKLGGGTGARVFCRQLGLELHFRWNDDCSMFQEEVFAVLKTIEAIAGSLTSDSESYMIFVDSHAVLWAIASVCCK